MSASTTNALPFVSVRSTKGCWTCRLRKKKCDEVRPGCLRCASVNIECHFGEKPRWIENPTLGKEELTRVKVLVGVSASRKRSEHRARTRAALATATAAAAAASAVEVSPFSPDHSPSVSENGNVTAYHVSNAEILPDTSIGDAPTILQDVEPSWLSTWAKDQEANLVMHYLDHVFYIQFRFHTPSISAGGRGWFLSLLTRTKPLYHAALSLSAFHQQSLMLLEQGGERTDYLHELELQHNLTLKELQVFISAQSLTNSTDSAFYRNVQILACVVQLISFELFNGGVSNWQVHLRAASDLVLMLHELNPTPAPSPGDSSQRSPRVQSQEKIALRFFTGCVLWFDMLSCVSTGMQSHLAAHHTRLLLGPTPELGHYIELHTICGARNWVMVLVSEIARLSAQKTDWRRISDYNGLSFDDSAREIEFRLLAQHREVREELDKLRDQYGGTPPHWMTEVYNKHTVLFVTNIFASAAIIYLHTVITSSDVSPSLIQLALRNTIESMRMVPDPRMFRGLVWPLCVAGCMASSRADQNFFRNSAKGAVEDSRSFGNSGKALEILERSWLLQSQRGKLVDCSATIQDLGTCVLLC